MATKNTTKTKRIIASMSNKGGVGKSVASKAIAQVHRERGSLLAAFDADGLVGGLLPALGTRFENGDLREDQDPVAGCGYYDFRDDAKVGTFFDIMRDYPDVPTFLHDMPGGSIRQFSKITGEEEGVVDGLMDALDSVGARMTIVMTLSHLLPATESVGTICSVFGNRVDYVAIVNRMWGKKEDFIFWNDGEREERALFRSLGGVEIELPAIPSGAFARSEAYAIPYHAPEGFDQLKWSERAQLQTFWKNWKANLGPAEALLGL